ncbi:MAG: hypothetical protein ABI378_03010 [Chitinophagaceae bacterium]
MPIGYICHINNVRHYGFIDCPELELEHLFFHIANCVSSYKNIFKGDKVSFEFDSVTDGNTGARAISFLQNASLLNLKTDFENGKALKGFLKKIDDKYFVKDIDTYVTIQLIVASYEVNIQEVYEDNVNKLIDYKIITFTSNNKIRAININRQFRPECKLIIVGCQTEGQVVGSVTGGYQIRIYEEILGFLPDSLARKSDTLLYDGDIVSVTCIQTGENLESVVFDLTANVENEFLQKKEKEAFLASIVPGCKYLGIVKKATGFGLFIKFGLAEGLLYVGGIIDDELLLLKLTKKEVNKLLDEVFEKGKEIDIAVEEYKDDRISLTWDKTTERNKVFIAELNSKLMAFTKTDET